MCCCTHGATLCRELAMQFSRGGFLRQPSHGVLGQVNGVQAGVMAAAVQRGILGGRLVDGGADGGVANFAVERLHEQRGHLGSVLLHTRVRALQGCRGCVSRQADWPYGAALHLWPRTAPLRAAMNP